MNFENVYWDQRGVDDDAKSASIVAIGDSWFWYPYPSGKGVFGGKGTWLRPALDDAKVSASLHRNCMVYLIDQFAKRLQTLVSKYPDRVFLVNSRVALAEGNWANELHPKPAGFRTIARNCWLPVLEETGLA